MIDNRKPKSIYVWDLKTFEFVEESKAIPDPNDASNYLIPNGATTTEPPKAKKGYVNIWDGKKWKATKA